MASLLLNLGGLGDSRTTGQPGAGLFPISTCEHQLRSGYHHVLPAASSPGEISSRPVKGF